MKRIRGIEKDPEYQRHYREALGEEKFARLWLPALGRWDIRVQTFFLRIGLVIAALALVAIVATSARFTGYTVLTAVPLVALTGWALARWFGGANYPTEHRAGWLRTIVIWLIIAWVARRLALMVLPDPSDFGSVERLFLAPFVIALCVVIGAWLHLHWQVTAVAGLGIALGFAGTFSPDGPDAGPGALRGISVTSTGQLTGLASSGRTALLPATQLVVDGGTSIGGGPWFDPTVNLVPPRAAAVPRPRAATDCQVVSGRHARRTALGLHGRILSFRAEVCWDADGHPVFATVDDQFDAAHEAGDVRPVQLESLDAFSAPDLIGSDGLRAGRRALEPIDRSGAAASGQSTTIARVSRDGNTVELAFALETRDPLVSGPRFQDQAGEFDGNGDGNADNVDTPDRLFSLRARDGYAIDLVTVTAARSSEAVAHLLRTTSGGSRQLASWQGTTG